MIALGAAGVRSADASVMFSGSGAGLSATASFTIASTSGPTNTLTILLSNTDAKGDDIVPSQVLSGVFFNLGTAAFSKVSATLPGGSSVIQTVQCEINCAGASNVGGEWGYAFAGSGFNPAVVGANQGISSSGYLGGANKRFDTSPSLNYDGPSNGALNGIEFGIVPEGWTGNGNGGVQNNALIEGPVKFVLKIPDGLTEAMISNVYFTYGTSYGDRTLIGGNGGIAIPEPGSLALMGAGLALLSSRMRRRRS